MVLSKLKNFKKKKNALVCIDSDGTAMNVMTIKHEKCFGPCLVREWGLEQYENEVLAMWNKINLYSKTRGNNRFLTLYMALNEIDNKYIKIDGLDEYKNWTETASSLSNACLMESIKATGSAILKKALDWSQSVNVATTLLTYDDKQPFEGVREFLELAYKSADIAIVSSAGFDVIKEEWRYHDLLKYVGVIAAQEDGTKKVCLEQLTAKGYEKSRVLMIGDALSDMKAAQDSGVQFYPMQIDEESNSWAMLKNMYFAQLVNGSYGESQAELINNFTRYFGI